MGRSVKMTLEETIIKKLNDSIRLKEEEIAYLIDNYSIEEKVSSVDWNAVDMETIVQFNNKYYCICWTKTAGDFGKEQYLLMSEI